MKIHPLNTGNFKLDGGAMFGVVPKTIGWQKTNPADNNNMCDWSMRCMLIEDGNKLTLIDNGIGNKQDDKFFSHYYLFGNDTLEVQTKMSTSNTAAQSGSSPSSCSSCGRSYTPRWLSGLQKWSKVCGNCGVLNLARFMEDNDDPDATIADISAGEQSGAFLRSLVKTKTEVSHGDSAKKL